MIQEASESLKCLCNVETDFLLSLKTMNFLPMNNNAKNGIEISCSAAKIFPPKVYDFTGI